MTSSQETRQYQREPTQVLIRENRLEVTPPTDFTVVATRIPRSGARQLLSGEFSSHTSRGSLELLSQCHKDTAGSHMSNHFEEGKETPRVNVYPRDKPIYPGQGVKLNEEIFTMKEDYWHWKRQGTINWKIQDFVIPRVYKDSGQSQKITDVLGGGTLIMGRL